MSVESTTERVLRLLALLQQRPAWTAPELAAELGVTDRSVRRDVARLRSLGYPVLATAGVGGGYRLGAGTRLPPLLLDDGEAIATAVSLRMGTGGSVAGTADAALRALTKLDQMLPPRLRAEVQALHEATATLAGSEEGIDAELLVVLSRACRDTLRVRLRYTDRAGEERDRTLEPVRMVAAGRRWYLMAWDLDRADWRTFRLDRVRDVVVTTWRFRPRAHPDPVEHVQRAVSRQPYRFLARVRLRARPEQVREQVSPQAGRVEDDRDGWCVLVAGASDLDGTALYLAGLGFPAHVLEPPELRTAAARLAERLTAMSVEPGPSADDRE